MALAREGETDQALRQLTALYDEEPTAVVLHDLITVAEWHGDHDRVRRLSSKVNPATAPAWALAAIGRAFAGLDRPGRAADWFDHCGRRASEPLDCRLAAARYRAAAGDMDSALALLDGLTGTDPDRPEVPATRAVILGEAGRWREAAEAWRRAARRAPGQYVYVRAELDSRLAAGDIAGARALARQHRLAIEPEQLERLRGDEALRALRALQAVPLHEPGRRTQARRVVRLLNRNVGTARTNTPEWRRAHHDRIVAYEAAGLPRQAIRARQGLEALGLDEPTYVTEAVCRAYQTLDDARLIPCLESLARAKPDDAETQRWLFRAYLADRRYAAALRTIDALARRYPDGDDPRTAAVARAWLDELPAAADRLRRLAKENPGDQAVATDFATVQRWRGWPRKALTTADGVLVNEPDHIGARGAAAHALMDLGEYEQAREHIQAVEATDPDSGTLTELEGRHQRDTGWGLSSTAGARRSDGSTFGGREAGAVTRLESPLLTAGGRLFARHQYEYARFPEGNEAKNHAALGWQERHRDWTGFAELHSSATDDGAPGVAAGLTWTPSDHWDVSVGADSDTVDAPLRGRRQGIGAEKLALAAGYRWHERRSLRISGSALNFDDGNQRRALGASLTQRLYTHPMGWLDGDIGVYASRNSSEASPFFNPASDTTAVATLTADWRAEHLAPQRLRQRVEIHAGGYDQEGFDTAAIGGISYGHRWRLPSGNSFHYSVDARDRVYDGDRERQWGLSIGFDWRGTTPWSR